MTFQDSNNHQTQFIFNNGNYTLLMLFLTSLNLQPKNFYEDFHFLLYPHGIIFSHDSVPLEYGEGLIEGDPLAKGIISLIISKFFTKGTYKVIFYLYPPKIWLTTYKQENPEATIFIDTKVSKFAHYLEEGEKWLSSLKESNGYKSPFSKFIYYLICFTF